MIETKVGTYPSPVAKFNAPLAPFLDSPVKMVTAPVLAKADEPVLPGEESVTSPLMKSPAKSSMRKFAVMKWKTFQTHNNTHLILNANREYRQRRMYPWHCQL